MLCLGRKPKEKILIGDSITITVLGTNRTRLGIEAPRDVRVVRGELADVPPCDELADVAEVALPGATVVGGELPVT